MRKQCHGYDRCPSRFDSTSTMAKLVSTLCVWQSKLLHLCNQEIYDMKGNYKNSFFKYKIRSLGSVHYSGLPLTAASNFDIDTYNKPPLGFLGLVSSISACCCFSFLLVAQM